MTVPTTSLAAEVWAALGQVRDPELDEPVTDLGFVAGCRVSVTGVVSVRLRLPTYFCAPNFAYLMVADAHDVLAALPGVTSVAVELVDHFAAEPINAGVAARVGFVGSFAGEAVSELDGLRADFLRKAVLAGTDRVCRPLVAAGRPVAGLTLGDIPPSPDLDRLRARRAELGLPSGDGAPLLIDPRTGAAAGAELLPLARLTRVSVDANSSVCRGLLRERYPEVSRSEEGP